MAVFACLTQKRNLCSTIIDVSHLHSLPLSPSLPLSLSPSLLSHTQTPGIEKAKAYLESVTYFMRHGDAIEVSHVVMCVTQYMAEQSVRLMMYWQGQDW